MPGLTKTLQMIKLDHQINLIDSPGVMFSGGRTDDGRDDANMVLRNVLRFEQLEDPIGAAYKVVERCTMDQLKKSYDLQLDFEDADQFIFMVAQKRGKLLKGGVPDCVGAAKIILKDWNDGRIEYSSDPPVHEADLRGEADVVSDWSREFDVEKLLAAPAVEVDEEDEARRLAQEQLEAEEKAQPLGSRALHSDEDILAGASSSCDAAAAAAANPIVTRPKAAAFDYAQVMDDESTAAAASSASGATAPFSMPSRPKGAANPFNPQLNQQNKKAVQQQKKKERKMANREAGGADEEDGDMQDDAAADME